MSKKEPPKSKKDKCLECGHRFCEICHTELISNEQDMCSLCASSKEHLGDLGWE